MTLDQILKHAYSRLNKDQSGNVYAPDTFNIDLPFFLWSFLNKRYGLPQNWRPGAPMPHFGFEVTQLMTDDLSPLKVVMGGNGPLDPGALIVNSNGVATLPSDYFHYSALNGFYTDGTCEDMEMPTVEVCTDQQFSEWLTNSLRNRKIAKDPYCNFQNGIIEFRPKTIGAVRFAYLKKFENPFYDYYTNATTLEVFYLEPGVSFTATTNLVYRTGATSGVHPSLSVELPLAEYLHVNFANDIVDLMSENLRSPFMKQVATGAKANDA